MNGAAVYYRSSQVARDYIEDAKFEKPTFVMLSEKDETIDSQYAASQLSEQFTNQDNVMIWYGDNALADTRITKFKMDLPEEQIVSASHISVMYSPDNPVYKRDGEVRLCFRDQPEGTPEDCSESMPIRYGLPLGAMAMKTRFVHEPASTPTLSKVCRC